MCQKAIRQYFSTYGYGRNYQTVICHMKTSYDNILHSTNSNRVRLISFELLSIGPEIMDIATLCSQDCLDRTLREANMLPVDHPNLLREWLSVYLSESPYFSRLSLKAKARRLLKYTSGVYMVRDVLLVKAIAMRVSYHLRYHTGPNMRCTCLTDAAKLYKEKVKAPLFLTGFNP